MQVQSTDCCASVMRLYQPTQYLYECALVKEISTETFWGFSRHVDEYYRIIF